MTAPLQHGALTIRVARGADAHRVAVLSGQLGYPATPEEITRRFLKLEGDSNHAVLVAEASESHKKLVVGWIHIFVNPLLEIDAEAEIGGLVVDEGYRSRGVGQLLMEHAEQWAREKGCAAVRLRSNVIRTRAHSFYAKLGYETIKTQKVFRKVL